MLLSVPELAKRLGVAESRARVLVSSGRIPGQRVGGRWVIDELDAANFRPLAAGRPLTEQGAWQFIHASQCPPEAFRGDLDAVMRHRLDRRIRRFHEVADPVAFVASLLARRADKFSMSANSDDLAELREDPRLHLSGVSHAISGLLSAPEVEAYVTRRDLPGVISSWFLLPTGPGARPNVTIRAADVVPDDIPPLVVAADLSERPGSREQDAAFEILEGLRCM